MLYHLSIALAPSISFFNVIHYVSFRIAASLLTVLFLSLFFGDRFIAASKKLFRAKAREHTPENHRAKDDMPTMGGLFIIGVVTLTALLWCNLTTPEIWLLLGCLIGFGAIGFWDDWSKIRYKKGISEKHKFRAQVGLAIILTLAWLLICAPSTELYFPFFKDIHPHLGFIFILWALFVIVGTSNAVNLTDGLDGLAIGSLISNFATFSIIAYLAGHAKFAHYLHIPFTHTSEVAILGVILVGASLGFLWFNAYPAQIFMGDVGSLALGASLGFMALMTKQEILLAIAGGLFVAETVSVILQVTSYRYFKRRIFKMAPLHHHFELLGWPESKITIRFAIISCILCLTALMTLKIR
jgi:phospho-N-acetylmuramoyl-pentapeptide-transferase